MSDKAVIWNKEDGICTITLNSPKTLNAYNFDIAKGLEAAVEDCFDENVRVVILTGADKGFCAGGDLGAASKAPEGSKYFLGNLAKHLAVTISAIRQLPKPVIACVNGPAFGVGMSFAMACDLRIASDKAAFGQAYTSVGLNQDGAWTLMAPLTLGWSKTMEMALLDTPLSVDEALKCGFVQKVFPHEQLLEETTKIAKKLAGGATRAFANSKALLNAAMAHDLECQMERERVLMAGCADTEDFKEGCAAVFEKRRPQFKGK